MNVVMNVLPNVPVCGCFPFFAEIRKKEKRKKEGRIKTT